MTKIIITGATGFLGSYITKMLLNEGYDVIALKRRKSNLRHLIEILDEIIFYDIEELDLSQPFEEHGPIEAVIHTATCYGRLGESATEIFEANTFFPLRLLEKAIAYNTQTFINTDTILERFLNAYALSKISFADWGRLLAESKQIRFMNVLLEHMYGPGDDSTKFTTWIVQNCLNDLTEISLTEGEQQRDFIYISDVVNAFSLLLRHSSEFSLGFHDIGLGSGTSVSLRKFVEKVHQLTSSTSQLNFGAYPYRKHEIMESHCDIELFKSIGWVNQTSLEEGLTLMIESEKTSLEDEDNIK